MYEIVTNYDEFTNCVNKLKERNIIWFRGQSNSEYPIEPTLFREKFVISDYKGIDRQQYNLRKSDAVMKDDLYALKLFKKKYSDLVKKDSLNDIDYLYLMQHYDIKTRLLDFSEDEFVGLYFATQKNKESKILDKEIEIIKTNDARTNDSSTIFCIDPYFLNKQAAPCDIEENEIINLKNFDFDDLKKIDLPFAIETDSDDPRILAQKSKFVFFGLMYNDYEYYSILKDYYFRIIIPNSCRKEIFTHLKKNGYNHSDIFPDVKGIALETNDEIEEKYKTGIKNITG